MKEYKSINVCNLIPQSGNDDFQTILFVLENDPLIFSNKTFLTYYRAILILEGSGVIKVNHEDFNFEKGDIIIERPSKFYTIMGSADLRLCYIGFTGLEVNDLLSRIGVTYGNFIFKSNQTLRDLWEENVSLGKELNSVASKSVLFTTLLEIGKTTLGNQKLNKSQNLIDKIKKYIDENYSKSDLNLKTVADKFFYSPKYLSNLFKSKVGVGFSEYLQNVRLQKAYALIESGCESVREVAYSSGYNDPLYFSRAFKKQFKHSPKSKREKS